MRPVLRRIAIHGGLTALVLGIMGLLFIEMVGMWMAGPRPPRPVSSVVVEPDKALLRSRVPMLMAFWGFLFVSVGELVMYRIRKNRTPPPPPVPDQTEALLQALLAEAEAKAASQSATPNPTGQASGSKEPGGITIEKINN
jgi:hypothetical protein